MCKSSIKRINSIKHFELNQPNTLNYSEDVLTAMIYMSNLFSKFEKLSEKKNISTFLTHPLIRTCTSACQGVKNISFSENLRTYKMNGP